jgi:hypothetical protein
MVTPAKSGLTAVSVAAFFLALGCYLAWKSGCVFDSKQGIGDAQLGLTLSGWALASATAACCALVFSLFLFRTGFVMVAAPCVALLTAPLSLVTLFVAESYGADSCSR